MSTALDILVTLAIAFAAVMAVGLVQLVFVTLFVGKSRAAVMRHIGSAVTATGRIFSR